VPDDPVALIEQLFDGAVAASGGGDVFDAKDPRGQAFLFDSLDPEVEFHEDPNFPEAGVYRGLDAIRDYLITFAESFDEVTFRVEDFIGLGEGRVLALYTLTTRGQGSGATIESHPGWLFEFRGGRPVRIRAWLDRETALRNAGVVEP
jgi:ketosteroid isomerase-like protein